MARPLVAIRLLGLMAGWLYFASLEFELASDDWQESARPKGHKILLGIELRSRGRLADFLEKYCRG